MKCLFVFAIAATAVMTVVGETYRADWGSLNARPSPSWWQDAKFGIFIHWGVYSVPAYAQTDAKTPWWRYAEQYWTLMDVNPSVKDYHERHFPGKSYRDLAPLFTAKDFDPAKWADLFRRAGAKYVVLTSRHHDGFALWPSKLSPGWNAGEVGPKRDLCGELSAAVKAAGLRMGFYFSHLQWHQPLYRKNPAKFVAEVNLPQLKELVMAYRPDVVWGDGEWEQTWDVWRGPEFLAWLYNESPVRDDVVVNDRWGKGMRGKCGDYYSTEYSNVHGVVSDCFSRPFEECRGIGYSFGFNCFETTKDYLSDAACIEELVDKVSRGGNLLLNIGPDSNGRIPPIMEERLLAIGKWLEVNGEAIYGTRRGTAKAVTNGVYCTDGKAAKYVIDFCLDGRPIEVKNAGFVNRVSLLGADAKVSFVRKGDSVIFTPPLLPPSAAPSAIAWAYRLETGASCKIEEVAVPGGDGGIVPYRYGAIYYSDEKMAFRLPQGVRAWRVVDMDGIERGNGEANDATLSFGGGRIGNRFGAFRLEAFGADGRLVDSLWFARLTSRDVRPCPWIGTGTHAHTGWVFGDARPVDLIAAAGIGVVRDQPLWERCEWKKGQLSMPPAFDEYVDALKSRGIRMNMLVAYGNRLYDDPCDPEAFARYAAFLSDHFRGRVDRFEIWNEPQNFLVRKRYQVKGDSGVSWVRKFVELTRKADGAIRRTNPDAIVAVTGEDVEYFLDMMISNDIARAHNAIAFHPYCHTQHRPEREYFLQDFGAKHRALAKAHGGADRWVITETGWTTYEGKGEFWDVAGCYPRASLSGQAACIVRMYLAAVEAKCEYACQYDFMDDGANPSSAEDNFGLVRRDGTPKPSFAAVAYLARLLGTAMFRKDLSDDPAKYRVACFVKGDKPILAAWCIEGECEWTVPKTFGPLVDCRDLCGNPQPVPLVKGRSLKLIERPIYILGM